LRWSPSAAFRIVARFIGNHGGHGGGIALEDCYPRLTQCVFEGNSGSSGGAISSFNASGWMTECVFLDNQVTTWGAAAFARGPAAVPSFENCTFARNGAADNGTLWSLDEGRILLDNCIIAFSTHGEAVYCTGDGVATLTCCDVFGNAGGDWTGCIADQFGVNGNIRADPEFCDLEAGDLTLAATSPCAPENNPECGLVGALPVGCGGTPVIQTTWGAVKQMFRR